MPAARAPPAWRGTAMFRTIVVATDGSAHAGKAVDLAAGLASGTSLDVAGYIGNLIPVTLGNIVGGSGLVALVYWIVYLRGQGEAAR